jgi:hypothetical protein
MSTMSIYVDTYVNILNILENFIISQQNNSDTCISYFEIFLFIDLFII